MTDIGRWTRGGVTLRVGYVPNRISPALVVETPSGDNVCAFFRSVDHAAQFASALTSFAVSEVDPVIEVLINGQTWTLVNEAP